MSSIDPQKTYDYHTAFHIKPTEVVYNLPIDMNRKKILNIALDKNIGNSAATVKMVKDLESKLGPFTKNNVYRELFEEFYDFSDASNYKLTLGASGMTFTDVNPNITFPSMDIANIREDGLRLNNKTMSLSLYSKWNFTICVVMQLWMNRSMSIKTYVKTFVNTQRLNLIYDKTTKKLTLQTYHKVQTYQIVMLKLPSLY